MSLFEGVRLILANGVNLFDTWFEYMPASLEVSRRHSIP